MLTTESARTYLARRRAARKFFESIPDSQVDLADWVREDHYAEHFQLSVEGAIQCGSVACLAGWLFIMPEYRAWCLQRGHVAATPNALKEWLGIEHRINEAHDVFNSPFVCRYSGLYDDPNAGNLSDKEIAEERLTLLINEAIEAARGGA